MWVAGFSSDSMSLMALAVSVGFVVDDAIVMIENMFRNLEKGMSPLRATIEGAGQIGFTVISISLSLMAVFIPLLFMGGIVGRLFREFAVTVTATIAISAVVSLTLTPTLCALFLKAKRPGAEGRFFLPGGRRLCYAEFGDPSRPVVLCVHGTPCVRRPFPLVVLRPSAKLCLPGLAVSRP